jgi:hypothetical protein
MRSDKSALTLDQPGAQSAQVDPLKLSFVIVANNADRGHGENTDSG